MKNKNSALFEQYTIGCKKKFSTWQINADKGFFILFQVVFLKKVDISVILFLPVKHRVIVH